MRFSLRSPHSPFRRATLPWRRRSIWCSAYWRINVTVDYFDADEFLDGFDDAAPADVVDLAREHCGELQSISMRWSGLGATGLFLAARELAPELSARQSVGAQQQRAACVVGRDTHTVRVAHLADRIQQDPRYRAVTQNQRTVVGRLVMEEL